MAFRQITSAHCPGGVHSHFAHLSCFTSAPQGLAREVVNRVQRLRKKAGLQATDAGAL